MTKNLSYFLIIFSGILFSSCISNRDLLKDSKENVINLTKKNLNGNYSSYSEKGYSLWKTLYECKTLKKDTTLIYPKTLINIEFDGNRTLKISAIDGNQIINTIELKGKIYKDYFSIKRNLLLIPIPFLYYRHSERKVIIGNYQNGNLIVKEGQEESLWILIAAGGSSGGSTNEYVKEIKH